MEDLEQKLRKIMMAGLGAVQKAADVSKDVIENLAESGEKTYEQLKTSGAEAVQKVRQVLDENEFNLSIRKKADKLKNLAQDYTDLTPQERNLVEELFRGLEVEKQAPEEEGPRFTFAHNNINVMDLEKSLAFYRDALGLKEVRRSEREAFTIVFLSDERSAHRLELTWLRDWGKPKYDLGDNEFHLAFTTDDYEAAHALHQEMGVICYENPGMGIYFIADPDGYWLEVVPER